MKHFFGILLRVIEFKILRDYFSNGKKFFPAVKYFIIFQAASYITALLLSVFNGNIINALIISVTAAALINFFIVSAVKNASADSEETEFKLKEYSPLFDEFKNKVSENFSFMTAAVSVVSLLFTLPSIITGLSGLKNSALPLYISLAVFVLIFLTLSSVVFIKYSRKYAFKDFNADKVKTKNKLKSSAKLIKNSFIYNLKSFTEKHILNKSIFLFCRKNLLIVSGFFIGFTVSLIVSVKFSLSFSFIISYTLISACLFSKDIFSKFNKYGKESERPFIFVQSVFIIIILLSIISPLIVTPEIIEGTFLYSLKDMILPVTTVIDSILIFFDELIHSRNILHAVIPVPLFIILYFTALFIHKSIHIIENISDRKLRDKLQGDCKAVIFGDNLSLYPFTMRLFISAFALLLLWVEIPFMSNLIYSLIKTLQVQEVFKIDIFTEVNITLFFKGVFTISAAYVLYISIIDFISSMFSHIMLFSDEIIYVNNLFITRNIIRLPVQRVNHISVKQNFIERFLDIGTLIIESSDNKTVMQVKGVTSITEKNRKIMDKVKIGLQKN